MARVQPASSRMLRSPCPACSARWPCLAAGLRTPLDAVGVPRSTRRSDRLRRGLRGETCRAARRRRTQPVVKECRCATPRSRSGYVSRVDLDDRSSAMTKPYGAAVVRAAERTSHRRSGGLRRRRRSRASRRRSRPTHRTNSPSGFSPPSRMSSTASTSSSRRASRDVPSVSVQRTGPYQSSPVDHDVAALAEHLDPAQAGPGEVVVPDAGRACRVRRWRSAASRWRRPRSRRGRGSWSCAR